jgi:hypothetical protein
MLTLDRRRPYMAASRRRIRFGALMRTMLGPLRWVDRAYRSPRLPTEAIIRRAFRDDVAVYAEFLRILRTAVGDADIVLRGSAVSGESYAEQEPFDADGPGTSDLDVVLVGPHVFDCWAPEAIYVGRLNTLPLSEATAWAAPALEPARAAAQALVGRPVHIQAMARWFLELRSIVQRQRHVTLDDP